MRIVLMLISDGRRLASVLSDRKSPIARQIPAGLALFLFSFNFQQVLALESFLN